MRNYILQVLKEYEEKMAAPGRYHIKFKITYRGGTFPPAGEGENRCDIFFSEIFYKYLSYS